MQAQIIYLYLYVYVAYRLVQSTYIQMFVALIPYKKIYVGIITQYTLILHLTL